MSDQPSIGRIVHYRHEQQGCVAAMIVQVVAPNGVEQVNLYRIPHPNLADGILFNVPQGEPGGDVDTWHWPERV